MLSRPAAAIMWQLRRPLLELRRRSLRHTHTRVLTKMRKFSVAGVAGAIGAFAASIPRRLSTRKASVQQLSHASVEEEQVQLEALETELPKYILWLTEPYKDESFFFELIEALRKVRASPPSSPTPHVQCLLCSGASSATARMLFCTENVQQACARHAA